MRSPIALLAAVAVLLVAGTGSARAEPSGEVGARIIGGSPAPAGAWPSIAYLSVGCTGSLVAERVVLTAAHCVYSGTTLISPTGKTARVGVIDKTAAGAIPWTAIRVPSQYRPEVVESPYDVALITLASAPAAPPMRIISPWQDASVTAGASAAIAGWGSTTPERETATYPTLLQQAVVPIIADAYCQSVYGSDFQSATMVCASDLAGGIDACFGDSGGPLALTLDGVRTLVGDTSWGPSRCADPVRPGVYGRISAFRPWLAEQLQVAPPTPTITRVASTGSSVSVTWAQPTGDGAWAALAFDVSDGSTSVAVEAPALAASLTRTTPGPFALSVTARNPARSTTTTWTGIPDPTRAPEATARLTTTTLPRVGDRSVVAASSDDPWAQAATYQWRIAGTAIAGATAASYTPKAAQAGKLLDVIVSFANAAGTGSATATAGRVRQAPQVPTGKLRVTGAARVGGSLRLRPPAVRGYPKPKATYRWFRNGRPVRGARAATYRVRAADAGTRIRGQVTWRNGVGSTTRSSRQITIAG